MATGNQKLAFAIRAVNEAQAVLKDFDRDLGGIEDSGRKAQRGSENAADGMSKANKEAERGPGLLRGFGGALGDVAKIAGAFVIGQGLLKAPGFLMDAGRAAAEDAAATSRLEKALRNAGGAYDEHLAKVNERIDAGQKLAFSDDDVRDSFQTLLAATGDVDSALQRQTAAMDLARGAGIPLEQASRMLGKINEENVEVFRRLGITLGDGATEMDALAAVQEKFGGQAETFATSLPGKWERFTLRIGEAKETLGAALIPVMEKAAEFTEQRLLPAVEALAEGFGPALAEGVELFKSDVLPVLEEVGAVITEKVVPPLQSVADWFTSNEERMQAAGVAIGAVLVAAFTAWAVAAGAAALATLAAAAPVIAIGALIAGLAAGVFLLIKHWDEITEKFPILGSIAEGVQQSLGNFTSWISSDLIPAAQKIGEIGTVVGQGVIDWFREHWDQIEAIVRPVIDTIVAIVGTMATNIGDTIGIIVDLIQGDWSGAWGNFKDIVDNNVELVKTVVSNMITFIKELGGLAWDAAKNVGSNLIDGLVNGIGAIGGLAMDIAETVGRAIKEFINTNVIDRLNRAVEFKIPVPGLPDISVNPPDIPHLASGGIVTAPTVAMVGEAGPEAVLPLDEFRDVTAQLGQINRTMLEYVVPTAEAMAENAAMLATFYKPAPRNPYAPGYVHAPARSFAEQGDDDFLGEYNALGYGDELARGMAFGAAQVAFQQDPMAWARMTWGLPFGAQVPAWASSLADRSSRGRQVNVVIQGYDDVHDLRRKLDQVGVFA